MVLKYHRRNKNFFKYVCLIYIKMTEIVDVIQITDNTLNNALKNYDVNGIYSSSHSIQGLAANFGLDALSHMAKKIQKHAKNHDEMEVIAKYVQNLEKIYSETRAEINKK